MTLSSIVNRISYSGNGSTTAFPFPYLFLNADDLCVIITDSNGNETTQTITTDYNVTGEGVQSGGTVTMISAPATGEKLTIIREVDYTQSTDLQDNTDFQAETLETTFDRSVMMSQQLKEITDRCIKLKTSSTETAPTVDDLSGNSGKAIIVNSTENGYTYTSITSSTAVGDFTKNRFSGTGSQTDFTLTFTPVTVNALLVSVDDVVMEPTIDYTVSGTTLTFTSAPAAGSNNIFVINYAAGTTANVPADDSVTTVKIQDNAVTTAKIAAGAVDSSALASGAVSTAKISDNAVTGAKIAMGSDAQGDILYYNGTDYVRLAAGTSGQILQTNGTGANPSWATSTAIATGSVHMYIGTTAPSGWLILNGDTIGSAASAATQANDNYETLFTLFWNSMADSEAPVSSGRGASAAADWAANKTITMPDGRGRAIIGTGTGSGLTARTHGDTDGAETHTLTEAELASHRHSVYSINTTGASGRNIVSTTVGNSPSYADNIGGPSFLNDTGSDNAHNNMQPWLALNYIIKW